MLYLLYRKGADSSSLCIWRRWSIQYVITLAYEPRTYISVHSLNKKLGGHVQKKIVKEGWDFAGIDGW